VEKERRRRHARVVSDSEESEVGGSKQLQAKTLTLPTKRASPRASGLEKQLVLRPPPKKPTILLETCGLHSAASGFSQSHCEPFGQSSVTDGRSSSPSQAHWATAGQSSALSQTPQGTAVLSCDSQTPRAGNSHRGCSIYLLFLN